MDNFYHSPTFGILDQESVRKKIVEFIKKAPQCRYRLIIGSDSQVKNGHGTDFVTAVVVHRVGEGGIYFWRRNCQDKSQVLRERIYQEALLSLSCAEEMLKLFEDDGLTKYNLEIHVDIGKNGETRKMLSEIVGIVRGSGFIVKTKPEAYGASKVADRHI